MVLRCAACLTFLCIIWRLMSEAGFDVMLEGPLIAVLSERIKGGALALWHVTSP